MNPASLWAGITAWTAGRSTRRDESVRRVAVRLAVQTIGFVLVLIVVLEGVVFVITEQALLGTLKTTLQNRARQTDGTVCAIFHVLCPQAPPDSGGGPGAPPGPQAGNGGNGQGGGPNPNPTRAVAGPSEASAVYVDLHLKIRHHDGSVGAHLLSPSQARLAMATGQKQCCATERYDRQDYLVYSAPLKVGGKVDGAVQTSISEHQYEHAVNSLVEALLIVALLGLVGSGGVSLALVGRALRPIRVAMQRQQDFVADAAHELRTPLAIQRTVGEVGMTDASSEDLRTTVEQMLEENRHLTRLVEDLSLLARSDTDAIEIEQSPVDLSKLLRETAEEIGYLASEKEVALQSDIHGDVTTLGDVLRLRQLVLILLDNALKHTPEGGTIRVRLRNEGGRALIEVADSGEGINPADLPRIFDRFYQADRARTGEGTGLGLAIAQWIVEAHGGQIRAGNTSPQGAIFSVSLPLTRADHRVAPAKDSYEASGS